MVQPHFGDPIQLPIKRPDFILYCNNKHSMFMAYCKRIALTVRAIRTIKPTVQFNCTARNTIHANN